LDRDSHNQADLRVRRK